MNDVVNELASLVGGSSTKRISTANRGRHLNTKSDHSAAKKTHRWQSKNHGLNKTDQTFHKIANGQSQPKPKQTTKKPVAPEKVIPLKDDDHAGTDDFSEFNG